MPRPSQLSPDNILRFLQLKSNPVALEELSRALQIKKSNRGALLKMLAKLKKRGLVDELSHSRFVLRSNDKPTAATDHQPAVSQQRPAQQQASRDEIPGRLVLHHDGYGFVVPDVPIPNLDGDLFIPRDYVDDAMHGDHVVARIARLSGGIL